MSFARRRRRAISSCAGISQLTSAPFGQQDKLPGRIQHRVRACPETLPEPVVHTGPFQLDKLRRPGPRSQTQALRKHRGRSRGGYPPHRFQKARCLRACRCPRIARTGPPRCAGVGSDRRTSRHDLPARAATSGLRRCGRWKRRSAVQARPIFQRDARQAPDADRNRLTVGTVLEVERFPLLCGKLHPRSNMSGSDNNSRRLEPRSAMYADQVGLRVALRLIEISRDTYGRMRQLCGVNTGCLGASVDGRQQETRQCKASPSAHHDICPSPDQGKGKIGNMTRTFCYLSG